MNSAPTALLPDLSALLALALLLVLVAALIAGERSSERMAHSAETVQVSEFEYSVRQHGE